MTPTLTATLTRSPTPTLSPALSPTPTPSASPTARPGAGGGAPQVLQQKAWPNPQRGAVWGLAVELSDPADGLRVKVYTRSLALAAQAELSGAYPAGWNRVSFAAPGLPAGAYYVTAQASAQGQSGACSHPAKLVRLP